MQRRDFLAGTALAAVGLMIPKLAEYQGLEINQRFNYRGEMMELHAPAGTLWPHGERTVSLHWRDHSEPRVAYALGFREDGTESNKRRQQLMDSLFHCMKTSIDGHLDWGWTEHLIA